MRIFFLLLAFFSVSCFTLYRPDASKDESLNTRNLIIFYDDSVISVEQLTQITDQKGTTLLYQYSHLKAIAISVPDSLYYDKIKSELTSTKGILGVEEDQIMHIQSTH